MTKAAFNRKENLCTRKLDLNLWKKQEQCHSRNITFFGAENWILPIDQKYSESFEAWCYRRMEKFSCTVRLKNEEGLYIVQEERDIFRKREGGRMTGLLESGLRPTFLTFKNLASYM